MNSAPPGLGLLKGRRALITGAAAGIGAATAHRFVEEGARVFVTDIDGQGAQEVARALTPDGPALTAPLDVTAWDQVVEVVSNAAAAMGGLDTIVANAGLMSIETLESTSLDEFWRVMTVNVLGVATTFKAAIPHLRATGGGVLLATASQASFEGSRELSAYAASKFAVRGLIESVAKEVASANIRVCAVAPGMIATPMLPRFLARRAELRGETTEKLHTEMLRSIPVGRLGDPDEVARTFVYLASPLADYVTGTTVRINGGM